MVIHNGIRIEGAFELEILQELKIDIMPNAHAGAMIKGIFNGVKELERWQMTLERHEVGIYRSPDNKPVFLGILDYASWNYEAGLYTAELYVVSASRELDIKKESVSYQYTGMTYEEILEKSIALVPGTGCICTEKNAVCPGIPLIQYQETVWKFVMRLASRLNTVVYPDTGRSSPYIWFGIPNRGNRVVIPQVTEYIHGISDRYNELAGEMEEINKGYFEYYKIETGEAYDIGEKADYAGRTWIILEKHAELCRGELRYTYLLGNRLLATVPKSYNERLTGMSILGTVIKSEGERVRIHLEIDSEQSADKAYPYLWVPDTGSVMYCMPEEGSTVSLYFPDADEANAVAVSCVRHNGDICSEMEDTQKRSLVTAEGKRMYMNPDEAGFDIRASKHQIMLKDDTGICLGSGTKISISAAQGISMKADTVIMETPGELSLMRGQMGKTY